MKKNNFFIDVIFDSLKIQIESMRTLQTAPLSSKLPLS